MPARTRTQNVYPRWSKDASRILYQSSKSGKWQLFVMDRDGSHRTPLTDGSCNDNFPDWSPDGTKILFNSARDADRLQTYEVTVATGEIRRLVDSPDDDTCARISPRGDRIDYLANLAAGRDDIIGAPPPTRLSRHATLV
jgi:Tol biopolymer transport system component